MRVGRITTDVQSYISMRDYTRELTANRIIRLLINPRASARPTFIEQIHDTRRTRACRLAADHRSVRWPNGPGPPDVGSTLWMKHEYLSESVLFRRHAACTNHPGTDDVIRRFVVG